MPLYVYEYSRSLGASVEKGEVEGFHLKDALRALAEAGVPNGAEDLAILKLPRPAPDDIPPTDREDPR